jgi:hypothetical protein
MRSVCVLLSFVALCATTLAMATPEPVSTGRATQAVAATVPSHPAAVADLRKRSDARTGVGPELKLMFTEIEGPATCSSNLREDGAYRAVLLDGSERWRSLLLGAPPLLA